MAESDERTTVFSKKENFYVFELTLGEFSLGVLALIFVVFGSFLFGYKAGKWSQQRNLVNPTLLAQTEIVEDRRKTVTTPPIAGPTPESNVAISTELLSAKTAMLAPTSQAGNEEKSTVTETPKPPITTANSTTPEPVSRQGDYVVQVAAFDSEKNARHLEAKLKKRGYSAFIFNKKYRGKVRYCVRVGPLETADKAKDISAAINKRYKTDTLVLKIK